MTTPDEGVRINWRWPAKRGNNYNPWYVIGWRMLWVIPVFIARCLFVGLITLMHGPRTGQRTWEDTH